VRCVLASPLARTQQLVLDRTSSSLNLEELQQHVPRRLCGCGGEGPARDAPWHAACMRLGGRQVPPPLARVGYFPCRVFSWCWGVLLYMCTLANKLGAWTAERACDPVLVCTYGQVFLAGLRIQHVNHIRHIEDAAEDGGANWAGVQACTVSGQFPWDQNLCSTSFQSCAASRYVFGRSSLTGLAGRASGDGRRA